MPCKIICCIIAILCLGPVSSLSTCDFHAAAKSGTAAKIKACGSTADFEVDELNTYKADVDANAGGDIKLVTSALTQGAEALAGTAGTMYTVCHFGPAPAARLIAWLGLPGVCPWLSTWQWAALMLPGASAAIGNYLESLTSYGFAPLHVAVLHQQLGAAQALLELGASPDIHAKESRFWWPSGPSPLHYAVSVENIDLVKLLLKMGANPNVRDSDGAPPLLLAAASDSKKNHSILKELLKHPLTECDLMDKNHRTALFLAALANATDSVKQLVNEKCTKQINLALLATAVDQTSQVKYLLDNGASVEGVGIYKPLLFAAAANDLKAVQLFLDYGADVHAQGTCVADPDAQNCDALMVAAGRKSLQVTVWLSGYIQKIGNSKPNSQKRLPAAGGHTGL